MKQSRLAKLIARQHLTTKNERNIVKNEVLVSKTYNCTHARDHLQAFDKSIIALKVALNKIASVMEEEENRYFI